MSIAYWVWHDIKKDSVKELEYTSAVISRYYELSFNQWHNTLLNLGERLHSTNDVDSVQKRLAIVNSAIKNYEELLAFGYTSPEGQVLTFSGSKPSDSLPNLMMSENSRRSFLQSKNTNYISIGEAYYFPNVLDWILPMRVPIRDKNGKLVAVNTTALQYKTMNSDLNGFGFDPNYRIYLVNDAFNTVQFYHPLATADYNKILGTEASLLTESSVHTITDITYYQGKNNFENNESIFIKTPLHQLNHTLYVSVNHDIIIKEAMSALILIIAAYLIVVIFIIAIYVYSRKKQNQYLSSLIESQANLNSIFESTNSLIGLFDTNKRLIEFNQSFAEAAKLTENITLTKGMGIEDLSSSKDMVKLFNHYQDKALRGEKFKETISYPNPEGGQIHYQLSYNPIFQGKKVNGLSMFVQDITELKNYQNNLESLVNERTKELEGKNLELETTLGELKSAQQKLVQAEKMVSLGVLAAGIGHEINNPLNFIKNGASALTETLKQDPQINLDEIQPFLEIINTGVYRANAIVKSLSHFSREVKSKDEECNINSTIEHCLTMLNNRLKNKVKVVKQLDLNCPTILGNEGKLHQAVLNIISNAEQAIAEKGVITIKTHFNKAYLIVQISDNGEGISQENIAKIADPFFTTKEPGVGTGLGLFITYNIIEEHNGVITVDSEVGKGTTFTIKFDLSE
ncbi:MAG: ATP-binding protein [Fulvivirga sp.]|uniref:ATP-binding protein n=1 Tax=Fulvivirga sp. TaxID=1931237 RepID=UPI0032EC700E